MEASIIVTYRCQNRCRMCHIWKFPTATGEEFRPPLLGKLPPLSFCNITGGEPFLREDIDEIVGTVLPRAKRVVISTNGYLTDRIVQLAKRHRRLGIRISVEGLPRAHDELRGKEDSFDHALRTLIELKRLGLRDIGFATTVSGGNVRDILSLFQLAEAMNVEFATAVVHNSYYFHKNDNRIQDREEAIDCFRTLVRQLLGSWRIKNWYRGYFNEGLIGYIQGKPRLLPCTAGTDVFFMDPWGEVLPCNGMEEGIWLESMGNLNETPFEELWSSERARQVREGVNHCPKNCWMVGTASPAIKRHLLKVTVWVIKNKLVSLFEHP